jgi:hypothetical protein
MPQGRVLAVKKLAVLFAGFVFVALPLVATAGSPSCPDYTGDGLVTTSDVLFTVDHYYAAKGDGSVFTVADIISTLEHYGQTCS